MVAKGLQRLHGLKLQLSQAFTDSLSSDLLRLELVILSNLELPLVSGLLGRLFVPNLDF